MRWNYLAPRLILGAIVWALFAFAFDPLAHRGLIASGEYTLAARVEIDEFQTGFFPPRIDVGTFRIANRHAPGTNLIEFNDLHVEMDGAPLLRKNYIIENAEVTGLRFGTAREDSGVLDREPLFDISFPKMSASLDVDFSQQSQRWLDQALDYAKGELDPRQLETVRLAEDLREQWNKRFDDLSARAKAIEARAKSLEDSADAKGNTLAKIDAYRRAAADANKLLADVEQVRAELRQLPQIANRDLRALDEARQRDQERIRQKTQLLTLDPQKLSEALLGKQLVERVQQTAAWLAWVRQGMAVFTDYPDPGHYRGIDVVFELRPHLPQFLIRNLKFDGVVDFAQEPLAIAGVVTGITSEPEVHGEPVVLHATGDGQSQIELDAVIDQTRQEESCELAVVYRHPHPLETRLGGEKSLSFVVAAASTECRAKVKLAGDRISGNVDLRQSPVRVSVARPDGATADVRKGNSQWNEAIETALAGIQNLEATLTLTGQVDHPEWRLSSNLGPQIADGLNTVLSRQIEQQRQMLTAKIDAASRERTDAFRKLLNDRHGEIAAQLNADDDHARKLVARLTGGKPLDLKGLLR